MTKHMHIHNFYLSRCHTPMFKRLNIMEDQRGACPCTSITAALTDDYAHACP